MNAFERVKRWRQEWATPMMQPLPGPTLEELRWGDKIHWETAEEIARRLDEPLGLESAPRDGSLFDVQQNGVPYLDCHFDSQGRLCQQHGYPSMTRIFDMGQGHAFSWTPRPADRIKPYSENANGRKYIP